MVLKESSIDAVDQIIATARSSKIGLDFDTSSTDDNKSATTTCSSSSTTTNTSTALDSYVYNTDTTSSIPLTDFKSSFVAVSNTKMSSAQLIAGQDYESDSDNEGILGDNQQHHTFSPSYPSTGLSKFAAKIRHFCHKVWQGPLEPKDEFAPIFKRLSYFEDLPVKFRDRIKLKHRRLILIAYLLFWFGLCYSILIPYLRVPPHSSENPQTHVYSLSCTTSTDFWQGKNAACGMNGDLCPEIENELTNEDQDVIIRCPALCDRGSWTYSLVPIGNQRIKYRGYFVGGGNKVVHKIDSNQLTNPYRADSYPCGAAVHAGLVSPLWGGCARLSYKSKDQPYFNSAKGHFGVKPSIAFDSFFKSSFFFKSLRSNGEYFTKCTDPRVFVLLVNIILGLPIIYLASGAVAYWTMTIVGFWTICLATDPPLRVDAANPQDFANLISIGLERFLPTCSILYILWHFSTKRTLSEPTSPNEKVSYISRVILFYPFFWLGVLNNVTFDRLPVDRLTKADLKELPDAILAVSLIVAIVCFCAVIQAYKIWLSGRFKKYLLVYSLFIIGLMCIALLPGLTLRVHHYILAMLLIPGCATRGRTALMFQGVLLGLFLSGASRWGLAAIAETVASLKRDDPLGTLVPPIITEYNRASGMLSWQKVPFNGGDTNNNNIYTKYSAVSLLINDIEEYVSNDLQSAINLKGLLTNTSTPLYRWVENSLKNGLKDSSDNILIYLRIGLKIPNTRVYSDYSNAAVLKWPIGELTLPSPGLT